MPRVANDTEVAAIQLATRGFAVLPLYGIINGACACGRPCGRDAGKHPQVVLVPHGVADASSDPVQAGRWFRAYPEGYLNIGLALGNLVVLDEDVAGAVLAAGLTLPNCPTSRTSRGHHYLFASNGHPLPNGQFAPGLDCKSGAAYVVAPPSMHVSGHRYCWVTGHSLLTDLPPPPLPLEIERLIEAVHAGPAGTGGKDGTHDLFGALKLEAAFEAIAAAEATRDGTIWRSQMLAIVLSLIGRGLPDDLIISIARRATWLASGWTHDQTDDFVGLEIQRARAKFGKPAPDDEDTFDRLDGDQQQVVVDAARARLRLVPPSAMDWRGAQLTLIKGTLGHGMLALIYGEFGSAKTLIAISIAMHIALGRPWCGRQVTKGLVVYLAPEGGSSLHLRFHAWCRHYQIDPQDDRLLFRTVPVRIDLARSEADLAAIIANVHEVEADLGHCLLLVVDTVSRALAGANENSPEDMGRFVVNCDELREALGATVLAVHHTPRGGNTPRGHSSLQNGADVRLRASRIAGSLFELETEHVKDGETGEKLYFDLHGVVVGKADDGSDVKGGVVTHATITAAGAPGRPPHLTERQLRVLQELSKAAAGGKWEHSTEEFNALCDQSGAIDHGAPESTQRGCRRDLKIQLANKRYITVDGDRIRLVNHGHE